MCVFVWERGQQKWRQTKESKRDNVEREQDRQIKEDRERGLWKKEVEREWFVRVCVCVCACTCVWERGKQMAKVKVK